LNNLIEKQGLEDLILLSRKQVGGLTENAGIINEIVRAMYSDLNELKQLSQKVTQTTERLEHRINNLDLTDIEGTPRQRLTKMVQRYAHTEGIPFSNAWKEFVNCFNTAYHMNLKARKNNYMESNGVKKLTYPEFLERIEMVEDAIRIADKMLNK